MPQKPLPPPDWTRINALDRTTEKGRMFHELVSADGQWVHGTTLCDRGCGYDFRSRGARLRDIGVPVETRPAEYSPVYEYRIEPSFIAALRRQAEAA
jgi:hypothetical protein